ncbi:muscarinic acetylcholine receptor m4-like [Plakobranchus ocellatus]|uniref:Muscarinic acetylcholine receptor m4-like n=1 Tax=Plakobranchus ocellatus TaxID=259542 RepID=A0AAV4BJG9_9GAST|nr:muscarinic acetylcholine receptor m4-like [Plakobranchus ocellatus]
MIALTWIVPACVFFTSVIGWQYFVGERTVGDRVCEVQFMSDAMFTFLLTIAYYWITLFVMCILYGGIYKVALDLQRKSDAKQAKMKSTMALAGDNPAAALRHFGEPDDGLGEGSMNNSSGGGDSNIPPPSAPPAARNSVKQKNSTAKPVQNNINQNPNNRKSIKAALPCPPGAQNVNTTSFSVKKQNARADGAEEDRSSSPAFDSDDENFGGKSGNGPPGTGAQRDTALFANTGGLVRSLHGDLFFNPSQAAAAIVNGVSNSNSTSKTLPPTAAAATTTTPVTPGATSGTTNSTATASPNYLQPPAYSSLGFASDTASDAEGSSSGGLHRDAEFDSVYSSSASDHRLDKQTTPLLSKQEKEQSSHQSSNHTDIINKGRSFIDEKSFLAASLHSDRAALLPAMMMTVSGVTPGVCGNTSDGQTVEEEEDSDVADLDHASSPIWKRRTSLPPLATDVFELEGEDEEEDDDDDDDDDDQSDSLFITEYTTTGCEEDALATTPTYAPGQLRPHPHQHHQTPSDNSREDLSNKSADTVKCLGPPGGAMQPLQQRPRTDTVNTMTSETTTYADTVTDDYSNSNSNASPAHQNFHHKGDATTGQIPNNLSVSFKGGGLDGAAVEAGINNISSPFFNTSSINNNNSGGSASGSGSGSNAANANNPAPSETNTNDDSSRSETHCLAAVRRRRDRSKDPNRLHSFVKSVRSRNSRRRNRRERKSKSENRARKALRTISFILGAFVCCWTPYHVAIMFMAMCSGCVNPLVYKFTYWMCYLNSPINPFCYAFANAQFKRTFLRILRFDWHRT